MLSFGLLPLLFLCPLRISIPIFNYRIFPANSPERPLLHHVYEFIPEVEWGMKAWFLGEHLTKFNMSKATVRDSAWTNERALHFINTWPGGYNYSTSSLGPIFVRISVWNEDKTVCLANYSKTPTIVYWDYRFTKLDLSLEMRKGSRPGEMYIVPKPKTALDAQLMTQVQIMNYRAKIPPAMTETQKLLGACDWGQISDSFELHYVFWRAPRVWYWSLRPYSGWEWGRPMVTLKTFYFATVCCSERVGCPTVNAEFIAAGHPVFTLDPCIPGDRQLLIMKPDVLIVSGTPLMIRPRDPSPEFVLADVPIGFSLKIRQNDGPEGYDLFTSLSVVSSPSTTRPGYVSYKLEKTTSAWESIPFMFEFASSVVIGQKYSMFLKVGVPVVWGTESAWQEMHVTPTVIPKNPNPPKRLRVGFTMSKIAYFESLQYYANSGFNLVPRPGYTASDFGKTYGYYTPRSRKEVWDKEQPGLLFGPEASLFHVGSSHYEMPKLFDEVLKVTTRTDSLMPLTVPNRAAELVKWQNAIDYFVATGNTDIAYDGYFYQRQLEVFGMYLNYTRPELLTFDIEGFSFASTIRPTVSQGANFNARRLSPAETDDELYDRVVDEMYGDIRAQFQKNSPLCEVTWYATRCYGSPPGFGYQLGTWNQYDRKGYICQPELYKPHKHPELLARLMRVNKQGCCCKNCGQQSWASPTDPNKLHMIPMPTHGCGGEYSSNYTLDWVIQLFTNGATGFQLYPRDNVDDARDITAIAEAMRMFGRPDIEDIIMDGSLGYQKVENRTHNIVVGVVESVVTEDKPLSDVLFGVSHLWTSPKGQPASFRFPYDTRYVDVKELRSDTWVGGFSAIESTNNPRVEYEDGFVTFVYDSPESVLPHVYFLTSAKAAAEAAIATAVVLVVLAVGIFLVVIGAIVICVVVTETKYCSKSSHVNVRMKRKSDSGASQLEEKLMKQEVVGATKEDSVEEE